MSELYLFVIVSHLRSILMTVVFNIALVERHQSTFWVSFWNLFSIYRNDTITHLVVTYLTFKLWPSIKKWRDWLNTNIVQMFLTSLEQFVITWVFHFLSGENDLKQKHDCIYFRHVPPEVFFNGGHRGLVVFILGWHPGGQILETH